MEYGIDYFTLVTCSAEESEKVSGTVRTDCTVGDITALSNLNFHCFLLLLGALVFFLWEEGSPPRLFILRGTRYPA